MMEKKHSACCMGAFALAMMSMWAIDVVCVREIDATSRLLRTGAASAGCIVCLGILILSRRRPQAFSPKCWAAIGSLAAALGAWLLFADFGPSTPAMRVAGFAAESLTSTWAISQAGVAIAACSCGRHMRVLCGGFALGCTAVCIFAALCVYAPGTLPYALAVAQIASILLSWPFAQSEIVRFSNLEAAADAEVTHPKSFIPFTNLLFIAIVLFACAGGFAYAGAGTGVENGALLSWQLAALPIELAAALGMAKKDAGQSVNKGADEAPRGHIMEPEDPETPMRQRKAKHISLDGLYHTAAGFLALGFGLGPFLGSSQGLTNALSLWALVCANGLFLLLMYWALIELAARNTRAAIPVVAFAGVALNMGLLADSVLWFVLDQLISAFAGPADIGGIVASAFFIVFFVFCTTALHRFSFDESIASVEPVQEPNVRPTQAEAFEARCARVAEHCRLTPRESEIFSLLAAGRNCQSIQERLNLTRNTVKAHTRNIYAKLDIHSQQQLIDIVEK